MDKTVHKKLTEKHLKAHQPVLSGYFDADMPAAAGTYFPKHEINILKEVAKDLLQPRPEAVASLLQMAKTL